jgi:oligopeptide transport system substrate-binding protein
VFYRFCSIIFVVAVIFCGCNKKDDNIDKEQENYLNVNLFNDPQYLHPQKVRNLYDFAISRMLFEGLTRISREGKPEFALIDKLKIEDNGKRYVFTLKKSCWTNGEDVTSYDFARAWKKAIHPDFPSALAFHMYIIKNAKAIKENKLDVDEMGVYAPDASTLVVELEYFSPYFLELLSFPVFLPICSSVDANIDDWDVSLSHFVSNGPFSVSSWNLNNEFIVKKNESYWDSDTVKLSGIKFVMVSSDTEYNMFEKNQLDWAGSPLSTLPVNRIINDKDVFDINSLPVASTVFIRVNANKVVLDTPSIRKALSYSINRKELIEHVLQTSQCVATGLVPIDMKLHTMPLFEDNNKVLAKKCFKEALDLLHKENIENPTIKIMYVNKEKTYQMTQAMQQQWKECLGITIQLEALESKVFYHRLHSGEYQLALGDWVADVNDPIDFLNIFKSKTNGTNNTGWENLNYFNLLEEANICEDSIERMGKLAQAETILIDEMPIIPIYHLTMNYVKKENIGGVFVSPLGHIDFKWAYKEKGIK